MDRKALEARLAASAVRAATVQVVLADGSTISLRKIGNDDLLRAITAGGDDLDREARIFTALLRFSVVDDDDEPLLRSYAEAAGFVNSLDLDDLAAMREAIESIAPAESGDEAVEAGKAF